MNETVSSNIFCVPNSKAAALIESLMREGAAVRIRVTGRSMEPTIRDGDILVIVPASGSIRWGDVALCRRGDASGECFIHRIVWRGSDCVRTKGDALRGLDPPVRTDGVIGVVQSVERGVGGTEMFKRDGVAGRFRSGWRAFLALASVGWGTLLRLR